MKGETGWECFHLLCLPYISSALNCKPKHGRSTTSERCLKDLVRIVSRGLLSFSPSSAWSVPCGLDKTLSDVHLCLVDDKWHTVTKSGATYICFLREVSKQATLVCSGGGGVIVAVTLSSHCCFLVVQSFVFRSDA